MTPPRKVRRVRKVATKYGFWDLFDSNANCHPFLLLTGTGANVFYDIYQKSLRKRGKKKS